MRHTTRLVVSFVVAATASGCALTVQKPVAYGREVRVRALGTSRTPEAQGELISVDPEKIIVLDRARAVREIPRQAVRDVSVRRHRFGGGKGLVWTLVGGLATGSALAVSCGSVGSNSSKGFCGGVFTGTMALWGIIGGLSSAALESSTYARVSPDDDLRRFARFPQGLPAGSDATGVLARSRAFAPPAAVVEREPDSRATDGAHGEASQPSATSGRDLAISEAAKAKAE